MTVLEFVEMTIGVAIGMLIYNRIKEVWRNRNND